MTLLEIPLFSGAQSFTVNLGNATYRMTLTFRDAVFGGWFLNVERLDGSDAILGIPVLPMNDLYAQHEYKNFGHLYAIVGNGEYRKPTYDDMGTNVRLFWSDEPWNTVSGSDTAN